MENVQYKIHYTISDTHWWTVSTNKLISNFVECFIPEGSLILDAGCGVGGIFLFLKDKYTFYGLDSSEIALNFCKIKMPNCQLIRGSVENLPFPTNTFKGVLSMDVLYHNAVRDDKAALAEMARVLVPGGCLFLNLPAYKWMASSHDSFAHSARRYTSRQLHELLRGSGFNIVRLSYRVSILFPIAVIQRKILNRTKSSDLNSLPEWLNTLLKGVMTLENSYLLNHDLPFGLSVIAIARKMI